MHDDEHHHAHQDGHRDRGATDHDDAPVPGGPPLLGLGHLDPAADLALALPLARAHVEVVVASVVVEPVAAVVVVDPVAAVVVVVGGAILTRSTTNQSDSSGAMSGAGLLEP